MSHRKDEVAIGDWTDRSGSITLGGTAQTVMAANAQRRYLFFQNVSNEAMRLDIGATAANATAIVIDGSNQGLVFEGSFVPKGAVSVLGATTGKAFIAKEG